MKYKAIIVIDFNGLPFGTYDTNHDIEDDLKDEIDEAIEKDDILAEFEYVDEAKIDVKIEEVKK